MHLARADQRGTMSFEIDARRLLARVMEVAHPLEPDSSVLESARFVVDPARPGPRRA